MTGPCAGLKNRIGASEKGVVCHVCLWKVELQFTGALAYLLPLPHSPSFSLFLKDLEVSLYISGLANVLQGSLDYIIFD